VRIVGVDGGQSSTRCLVVDERGHVLGHGRGGPSNHLRGGRGTARLRQALATVFAAALPGEVHPEVAGICLGMTGVTRGEQTQQIVEEIVREYVSPEHMYVCGDMSIALAGAAVLGPGVLVYAGTGANTYGVDESGPKVRVGGWGYLIDDEGAGYDLGRQALKWVFRAEDGRGRPTFLREKFLAHFGCATLRDLLYKVYEGDGLPRPEIAALARLVGEAAAEGDAVAQSILALAGQTLAETAVIAIRKLGKQDQAITVYPAGGVFGAGSWIMKPFITALRSGAPHARVASPRFPPVAGAVFLALRMLDINLDERFLDRLSQGLEEIGWMNCKSESPR